MPLRPEQKSHVREIRQRMGGISISKKRVSFRAERSPALCRKVLGVAESRNLTSDPSAGVSREIPRLRSVRCAHSTEFILSAVEGLGMTRVFSKVRHHRRTRKQEIGAARSLINRVD